MNIIGRLNVQNGSTVGGAGAGNQATNGGGIYNDYGTVTVDASTISANTASDSGGGIANWGGTVTVNASTVSANTATNYGGGIWNGGTSTLNVQNGSTIGGAGAGNQADFGGGIFNFSGTTTVTDSRILYNTGTTDGGGVYNDWNATDTISVTASCIIGNSATAFLNNQAAQQIATGNWWGAATGPNTPGADTSGGNVNTSGFLAAPPIPGCSRPIYLPIIWATFH